MTTRRAPHDDTVGWGAREMAASCGCGVHEGDGRKAVAVDAAVKDRNVKRLRRIEGQVRGLQKMVEDDRYCVDVLTQLSAVRSALRAVEEELLRDHVAHCVENAIASGDAEDQRRKVAELIEVLGRSAR